MTTSWSPQQEHALKECSKWIKSESSQQVFYLAGYAGTGKTTLAKHLVSGERWLFAAFTGKASHVLRQKGCHNAQTIHSLIYRPSGESKAMEINEIDAKIQEIYHLAGPENPLTEEENKRIQQLQRSKKQLQEENRPRFALWANSPLADFNVDGIVIDEVSMVDEYLGRDLESFGKKILVLGDPAQLPPVGAGGYFTKRKPNIMLTEVHRHAKESSILYLATIVREGGDVTDIIGKNNQEVLILNRTDTAKDIIQHHVLETNQVLCGLNASRHAMNSRHRQLLGRTDPTPMKDDRVVCLRNDHEIGVFNGSQWIVQNAISDMTWMTADMNIISEDVDNRKIVALSWLHHFIGESEKLKDMGFNRRDYLEFDWSYALTVHKAQGSQWDSVVLFDQSKSFRGDARKWLYTGITRASKKLVVVI